VKLNLPAAAPTVTQYDRALSDVAAHEFSRPWVFGHTCHRPSLILLMFLVILARILFQEMNGQQRYVFHPARNDGISISIVLILYNKSCLKRFSFTMSY